MSPNVNMYAAIEEKGYNEGTAYVMTENGGIIEVHIYGGIVFFAKSLKLGPEQVLLALAGGNVSEFTFRKAAVKPETAQPSLLAHTFPAAVAASALNPEKMSLSRLFKVIQLICGLMRSGKEDGVNIGGVMLRQLGTFYRGFVPDVATLQKRIGRQTEEFGVPVSFLEGKPMPGDVYAAADWIIKNFETVKDSPMKEVALYFVLFGEVHGKAVKTTIEKETSLGGKQGVGVLSKVAYADLKDMQTAQIYKGIEKVGDIKIEWHSSSKKETLLLTKADMDKMGLENGKKVALILGV